MTGSELRDALRDGRRVYGTLIVSTSPQWVVPVKSLGLDFVFIDTEHIAIDREKLSWMCHAYREAELAPIVRIASPDPFAATMAIDGGAVGIVAPYIETADQVRELVGAVKYRPLKGLRLKGLLSNRNASNGGPAERVVSTGDTTKGDATAREPVKGDAIGSGLRDYLQKCNSDHLFIANIESRPAMEALDEILSIDELDAVLVGPHDLSCSIEMPEQYMETKFIQCVDEIIEKARARGKGAGIHMVYRDGLDQEIRFARRGANLILHRADIMIFRDAMRDDLTQIRMALGDERIDERPSINI